jgi:hypothetical protein
LLHQARGFSACGWLGAIVIAVPVSWLAAPTSATAKLALLGGGNERTVFLTARRQAGQRASAKRTTSFVVEGLLHLNVRNTATSPLRLRVLYSSAPTGTLELLPGSSKQLSFVRAAPDQRRFGQLARTVASRARTISTGSRGAPHDAAGSLALLLASSLAVAPGHPSHREIHELAATLYLAVRDNKAAPPSRTKRAATELVAVACPPHRRCPVLSGRDVVTLLSDLNRVVAQPPAGVLALQRTLVRLAGVLHNRSVPFIGARTVTRLDLRFRIPEAQAPSGVEGTLEIDGYTPRAARLAAGLTVALKGQMQPLGDIQFDPKTVVLKVVQRCGFACDDSRDRTVHLYGSGVGKLLATFKPSDSIRGAVVHGKDAVDVDLTGFKRDPAQADAAMARVELAGTPDSGNYSGTVPLSRLLPDSPGVNIEVHSEKWVAWAVLFVFLGVLASGWAFQRLPRARRKSLIRRALQSVTDELLAEIEKLPVKLRDHAPVVRDLTRHLDSATDDGWTYYSVITAKNRMSIVEGTRWARNDDDLKEVETAAIGFIENASVWQTGVVQLGALAKLVEFDHDEQKQSGFRSTSLSEDTRQLMGRVSAGSVTDLENEKLLKQLAKQAAWYRSFAEAWELRVRLVAAGGETAVKARGASLGALDREAREFWRRAPGRQEKLEARLRMLAHRLERLRHESNEDPVSPDVDPISIPPQATDLRDEGLRSPLLAQGHDLQLALSLTAAAAGHAGPALDPPPEWAIPTAVGIATKLKAPSDGDQGVVANGNLPDPTDQLREYVRRHIGRLRAYARRSRFLLWLRLTDLFVSGAIVLVISVAYTATLYNEDWGTVTDYATAFGAGFLGHVTVNWALLPIYRSVRLRAGAPKGDGAPTDIAAAGVGS